MDSGPSEHVPPRETFGSVDTVDRSWYDNGMDTPRGGWGLYDIHHMKPLEFGGVTSFENMTPIIRGTHQTEFNTFWRNYGK